MPFLEPFGSPSPDALMPSPKSTSPLSGKNVVLGVTGSVAAYKAVLLLRLLLKAGARVQVVLSRGAARFVGAATFSGLTGEPTSTDMFEPDLGGERHVELAAAADLILVVPATADVLSRFASGRAGDLMTALVLSARSPILIAPAMHPSMWTHPATQRNVATLRADGRVEVIGPAKGEVASGDQGVGRMVEPEQIMEAATRMVAYTKMPKRASRADLAEKHVIVTAGPTVEDIDPVRFISNRSSGKMGFAIAAGAAARGARVTLIAGPVVLETPPGVTRKDVRSALDMQKALSSALGRGNRGSDVLVMCAAVGDYRPEKAHTKKLKRGDLGPMTLKLAENPDLLAEIGRARRGKTPLLVGFAVETGTDAEIIRNARKKLASKKVDVVVANHAGESMGREDNRVLLVTKDAVTRIGPAPKTEIADRLLDFVTGKL